jgi:hypothetical protein
MMASARLRTAAPPICSPSDEREGINDFGKLTVGQPHRFGVAAGSALRPDAVLALTVRSPGSFEHKGGRAMKVRLVLLSVVCMVAAWPAAAAAGDGRVTSFTDTAHASDCSDMEFTTETGEMGVITTCFNTTFVFHVTQRRDGGFTAVTNSYNMYSYTTTVGGVIVDEGSGRAQEHRTYVSQGEELQVAHELTRFQTETGELTCSENILLHVANEEVRVNHYEATCEPA